MKKKQLVAVFVMMLAAATMATACGGSSDPKAKDALKYLDDKQPQQMRICKSKHYGMRFNAIYLTINSAKSRANAHKT